MRSRPRAPAVVAACFALCGLPACQRRSHRHGPYGDGDTSPPPSPPVAAEATVRVIQSRDDVPLKGPRVEARKGDWLLRDGKSVAVVSSTRGSIIDFGAEGGDDALVSIDPTVFIGLDAMTSIVESVGPSAAGSRWVLIRRRILSDPPLRLDTYVTFADGVLRMESVASASEQAALAVTLGEVVAWGNVPTWVEGHGFVRRKDTLSGDFIAREGFGVAYALAVDGGHVMARFATPTPGFHEWARTGERLEGIAPHGFSRRRVVFLAQAQGALGRAVLQLPAFAHAPVGRFSLPASVPAGVVAEVARCDATPFGRFDAVGPDLALPRSCWRARLTASGHAPGAWLSADSLAGLPPSAVLPTSGTLRWAVRERRAPGSIPLPARILVRGLGETPDPDWGEDPVNGAALDVVHTDRDGEIAVPPGRYHVTISRGFEYTMSESDLTVESNKTAAVNATLERLVDTQGWIAADLHVHAVPSPDAPAPLPDRVRALAAAGVEVAVATDHNAITDYAPVIRELALTPWLTSLVGDEVTTRGVLMGHYNVFPLTPGSIPVPFERIAPGELVSAARAAAPADRAKVVQLNHPRMGSIGYFELARFDPRDVTRWRASSTLHETGFDAIEVYNGDDYERRENVERAMTDWYALLNAGVHITATGNSDSHRLTYHECGVPRNLVRVGDDDPARLDATRFVDAIRAGRVVVSGGPFVQIEVAGHGVGETAPPAQEVHVTVDAPPWVDVSRVDIVRRGEVIAHFTGPFQSGTRRLDRRFPVALAHGDWVLAVASGEHPMAFLARAGATPLGFTNPVWIE